MNTFASRLALVVLMAVALTVVVPKSSASAAARAGWHSCGVVREMQVRAKRVNCKTARKVAKYGLGTHHGWHVWRAINSQFPLLAGADKRGAHVRLYYYDD